VSIPHDAAAPTLIEVARRTLTAAWRRPAERKTLIGHFPEHP
jgi:hypothetical protein